MQRHYLSETHFLVTGSERAIECSEVVTLLLTLFIIQQIVTLSKHGHDALDI